eukprot:gene24911-33404_t
MDAVEMVEYLGESQVARRMARGLLRSWQKRDIMAEDCSIRWAGLGWAGGRWFIMRTGMQKSRLYRHQLVQWLAVGLGRREYPEGWQDEMTMEFGIRQQTAAWNSSRRSSNGTTYYLIRPKHNGGKKKTTPSPLATAAAKIKINTPQRNQTISSWVVMSQIETMMLGQNQTGELLS